MIVTLTRSGGFAGMLLQREADLADAPAEVRAAADHLVHHADAYRPSADTLARDTRQYELEFREGRKKTTLAFDERSIPDEALPVIDYLMNG